MPKQTKELTALEVKRITSQGRHAVGTVPGLYLWVRDSGTKNWVLRVTMSGKRSDVGLGGYPAVPLTEAIKKARELRTGIEQGHNPIAQKRIAKQTAMTFRLAAEEYIKTHRAGWKNAKHAQQWQNTLETYAHPMLGDVPVKDVETPHVLAVLQPHWATKNETMVRVRNRIELILSWAMASGHRERGFNPAAWRGHLDHALPRPSKVNHRQHHPAMAWLGLPAFMNKLKGIEGMSARCLEFTILTACRSGESRLAVWDEIDIERKLWSIPGSRTKSGRPHRVPLADEVAEMLQALPQMAEEPLVFFGLKENTPLSDMSLTMVLRRHAPGVTVHGFRSTFRDWAAETTSYPNEVCEMALAHAVGDAVEAAYRRGDLFAKRAALMQEWADYAAGRLAGEVVGHEKDAA
jgi:integrase